ncbi:hypothetical protein BUE80_DR008784 [Diplocarpon rosae]|nr:hypothetical protein BUE80_DR008784 [Diplocarpon rosae]
MPSIGPELPPHLAKRKRSIDDEAPNSPPRKVQAATAPSPQSSGPTMPPTSNPDELDLGNSSEDEYGPSVAKSTTAPSKPSTPPKKQILGPAPPPANLSERPSYPADDSSDSDDDFGPSLPPAPGSTAESAIFAQQKEEEEQSVAAGASARPQRAEWMLAPPTDSDMSGRVDPTKLKNRKFASGKGAKAPAEKSGISAIWTETPDEKRQRLEDEVLGRRDTATGSRGGGTKQEISKELEEEEQATAKRIAEYNKKNRGKSLYEEREKLKESKGEKIEEDDDPSKRGFDREKDMALGGRLGHGQKREMLAKAADFGSRFQKGRYL